MDRRARKAFEDEPKGPSKFAGRRAEHRTQDTLRWRVPVGLQWVEWHDGTWDDTWKERLTLLQQTCPGIKAHHIVGDACVEKWSLMWILQRMWAEIFSSMKRSQGMHQAKGM